MAEKPGAPKRRGSECASHGACESWTLCSVDGLGRLAGEEACFPRQSASLGWAVSCGVEGSEGEVLAWMDEWLRVGWEFEIQNFPFGLCWTWMDPHPSSTSDMYTGSWHQYLNYHGLAGRGFVSRHVWSPGDDRVKFGILLSGTGTQGCLGGVGNFPACLDVLVFPVRVLEIGWVWPSAHSSGPSRCVSPAPPHNTVIARGVHIDVEQDHSMKPTTVHVLVASDKGVPTITFGPYRPQVRPYVSILCPFSQRCIRHAGSTSAAPFPILCPFSRSAHTLHRNNSRPLVPLHPASDLQHPSSMCRRDQVRCTEIQTATKTSLG